MDPQGTADLAHNEALLTSARLSQLDAKPILGRFDAAHLSEIHRHITQDLPGLNPGQFRDDAPSHVKARELSTGLRYEVPYSRGSEVAQQLDARLNGRDVVGELRGLDKPQFAEKVGQLYGDLDRIHPFTDSNSRALRAFVGQIAKEAGREIDWAKLQEQPNGRDLLYLARDHAVFQRAYPGIDKPGFEPADRHQNEALHITEHAGKAYLPLAQLLQRYISEPMRERELPAVQMDRSGGMGR